MLIRMLSSTYNGAMLFEKGDVYDVDAGYAQRLIAGGQAELSGVGQTQATEVFSIASASGQITSIWTGTQAQYDAISVKDDSTLYVIVT